MEKVLILILLAAASPTANGNDAASMLQMHDKESPATVESPAPLLGDVKVHSNTGRDDSMEDLWASTFAGEELLQKEWMANSSGESPGIMRMMSRGDGGRTGEGSHTRVWIPAQPRSGSTLLMDMLSVPVTFSEPHRPGGRMSGKFVLFEPCHGGDFADGVDWDNAEDKVRACGQIIESIGSCDFSNIAHLSGWDRHQSLGLPHHYTKQNSREACRNADLVVFKSVFHPSAGFEWVRPRLEHVPSLLSVMNVRDPRSVLASQKRVFSSSRGITFTANLQGTCEYYATFHGASHPRLLVVKFEDMIRTPWTTMETMYRFLGLEFGKKQRDWIWNRFGNGHDQAGCARAQGNYSTCSRDVESVINKWRHQLTEADLTAWSSQACRTVAADFDYQ